MSNPMGTKNRPDGTGSIRQRGETFTAYWFTRHPATGERVQHSKGGFRTQREAGRHLKEVLADVQRGTWAEPKKVTLANFLTDEWLPAIASSKRPTTVASYTVVCNTWLIPHLGGILLPALTARDVNGCVDKLRAEGGRNGAGLGDRSVQYAAVVLGASLKYAVAHGTIQRSPMAGVERPRNDGREMSAWSPAEAAAFLDKVADDRMYAAWLLFLTRGPRRGEVAGLRWADVDLEGGRMSIRHTRVMVDAKAVTSTPKTAAGVRTVPLDAELVSALRAHRRRQAEECMKFGRDIWTDSGYVFVREDGNPPPPEYFSTAFEGAVRRAGVRSIRLHDTRHTAASIGLQAGVPTEVISKWLGHGSVAITQAIYQHLTPTMLEDAGSAVTSAITSLRRAPAAG